MKKLTLARTLGALCAGALLVGLGVAATATQAGARSAVAPVRAVALAATPTLFDLNGTYTDGGSARPVISDVNDILTVDMSSQHRPTATGVVVNSDTILVTFPDDATYGAKLVAPGTIAWSNGSTWRKLSLVTVPNVVGLEEATAVSTLRSRGFAVTTTHPVSCNDPDGTVTRQTPAGGSVVVQGSLVRLTVPVLRLRPPCP
jgi:PASTA domain